MTETDETAKRKQANVRALELAMALHRAHLMRERSAHIVAMHATGNDELVAYADALNHTRRFYSDSLVSRDSVTKCMMAVAQDIELTTDSGEPFVETLAAQLDELSGQANPAQEEPE